MAGTWIGYVYALIGCGVLVGLVAGSTALLYAVARTKRKDEPRVRVIDVSRREGS